MVAFIIRTSGYILVKRSQVALRSSVTNEAYRASGLEVFRAQGLQGLVLMKEPLPHKAEDKQPPAMSPQFRCSFSTRGTSSEKNVSSWRGGICGDSATSLDAGTAWSKPSALSLRPAMILKKPLSQLSQPIAGSASTATMLHCVACNVRQVACSGL